MLKIIVALFVVSVVVVAALYFSAPKPTVMEFQTYEEAVTGDAYRDHWIPDVMPYSATDIHLVYEVDSGFLNLQFSYAVVDEAFMLRSFEAIDASDEAEVILSRLNQMAWKTTITDNAIVYVPTGIKEQQLDWKIYLAIDQSRQIAWYSVD
ncbi:MAG: hypothetical protein SWL02_10750 [Pseudomonadota bacterium]|nr:hypothetical protein [Pseudomonadota bacterium]